MERLIVSRPWRISSAPGPRGRVAGAEPGGESISMWRAGNRRAAAFGLNTLHLKWGCVMKKLLLGWVVFAFGTIGSASAADMALKAPIAAAPAVHSWTGCYLGGHVGGLWAHKDWTLAFPDPVTPLGGHDADSWLG